MYIVHPELKWNRKFWSNSKTLASCPSSALPVESERISLKQTIGSDHTAEQTIINFDNKNWHLECYTDSIQSTISWMKQGFLAFHLLNSLADIFMTISQWLHRRLFTYHFNFDPLFPWNERTKKRACAHHCVMLCLTSQRRQRKLTYKRNIYKSNQKNLLCLLFFILRKKTK